MRITEIRLEQKKNTGNYESRTLGFSAVIEEGEGVDDAITRLEAILDWHINHPERQARYRALLAEIHTIEAVPDAERTPKQNEQYANARKRLDKLDAMRQNYDAMWKGDRS